MLVMKFGGSSVANRSQIEKVLDIVRQQLDQEPILVCSAHKGVTDDLIRAAQNAAQGKPKDMSALTRQTEIATSLGCDPDLLKPLVAEVRDLLRGIRLVRELSPRSLDYIASFGERWSVRCIADFFSRQGVAATAYDAWDVGLLTDDRFGRARPLPGFEERIKGAFPATGPDLPVPVVAGFAAKNVSGDITTLGRNGSDLTATILGAALKVREVQIWSDTDGVMTADPSIVPQARSIPSMRFEEAAELAFFGSRVLHPATLLPAIDSGIPVRVLNTNRPDHPGTVIAADSVTGVGPSFTSIAYKAHQSVVTIVNPRMLEQVGFLAKVFGVLGQHGVIVDMVATSEVSVSATTHDEVALEGAIDDLAGLGRVDVQHDRAIVAVVGRRLHGTKGVAAKVMGALGQAGVNIEMHSVGMASNNISVVIEDSAIPAAIPALHGALFA